MPLRQVRPASAALARSQSIDYVSVNKRNAPLTPRRVQPPPPPSRWKLSRFGQVKARVHEPKKEAKPLPQ